ncbi:MAG: hypothetical protein JW860_08855 [Sedimentisphaerales bacterium]|nr:hypothetical protein [Sedimentisphaerales bacterium]
MSQVNNYVMKHVLDILENSHFTSACFEVTFPPEGDTLIDIAFIDYPEFYFRVDIKDTEYNYDFVPAYVFKQENDTVSDFDIVFDRLDAWTTNVRHELLSLGPVQHEFQGQKNSFNKIINEEFDDPEELFSRHDIEELHARLDELAEECRALHHGGEFNLEELNELESTIAALQEDARYFSRKTWYRTAGNKLISLAARLASSQPGQRLLTEGAKKLFE